MLALAAFLVAAVVFGGVLQSGVATRRPQATLPTVGAVAPGIAGPDELAAAFRGAFRCMSLTFAARDPAYFRARPDDTSRCARFRGEETAIYRQVNREFRLVLDTTRYSCPVRSLPAAVQAVLGVCPRSG